MGLKDEDVLKEIAKAGLAMYARVGNPQTPEARDGFVHFWAFSDDELVALHDALIWSEDPIVVKIRDQLAEMIKESQEKEEGGHT